jgi:hypothetical protein
LRLSQGAKETYFNNAKIGALSLGIDDTLVNFDTTKVELVYVAIAPSGENKELSDFKISINRLSYE